MTDARKDYDTAVAARRFSGPFTEWMGLPQDTRERLSAVPRSPEALTNERKNHHGDWFKQSECANELKDRMRGQRNWHALKPYQAEALDMIATKISRILEGDPNHEDHWDDIAGYAFLGKGGHKS